MRGAVDFLLALLYYDHTASHIREGGRAPEKMDSEEFICCLALLFDILHSEMKRPDTLLKCGG